ncbi:hypothetical protein FisN_27Lh113 [Fistulifera solaris]|uniref:BZIP domain-containing protein n=1 Tax=Fistulifera solaris TaxID=1519565 RepID=A0A1Z5KAQ7_FISSO|nr:hypothetical protein FisN_27Lh113 [Fistulifera solaris]|eukprot:GAX23337.1 hypothetical protein FisN_27Lh113 [Fistulifera solaris]
MSAPNNHIYASSSSEETKSFLPSFSSSSTVAAVPSILPTTEEDFRKALQEAFLQGTQAAKLPKSPEEFAQALQEAFARGAQAAVGRKPAPGVLSSVVSCPDLYRAASPVIPFAAAAPPPEAISAATILPHNEHPQYRVVLPAPVETRSFSMPDMTALQQEDLKRQNRLARNRASARQRRLRKKHLVESYEAQVIALEQRLQKLHNLQWGETSTELLNALSLDRGQDELKSTERQQAAAQALAQQLQAVLQLEQIMEEQFAVYQVAMGNPLFLGEGNEDLALELTDEQRLVLQEQAKTWQEEWDALQTTKEMLQALQEHEWLWKNGIHEAAEPFKSLLSKQQRTKWYIWADANGDALDELYVVEPQYADGPLFQFGTEDLMPEDAAKLTQATVGGGGGEGQLDWTF